MLSFINIFLFKNRKLQLRICVFNVLLIIALIALTAYFLFFVLKNPDVTFEIASIFPIIALILILMGRNGIKKDEKLIRSIDRIR